MIDIFSGRPYCLRISKVDSLLYAGNNLDKAQDIFAKAIKAPATDQADRSGSGHACFGSGRPTERFRRHANQDREPNRKAQDALFQDGRTQ